MATGLCRYDALATTLAFLDGVVLEAPLDTCDEPTSFVAVIDRRGDGMDVELRVQVCAAHDQLVSLAEGYEKSIGWRADPTT